MGSLTKKLLVLRGLTDNRHTVLKFSEPAGAPRAVLFGSLLDGIYNRAFLIEEFEYLSMCFGLDGSKRYIETIRQVFGDAIVIAMKRDDNLVVFAGNALHNPQHVRLAVRNAERAEDRLGLFFPTLIQCLNDIADRWICGVRYVLK